MSNTNPRVVVFGACIIDLIGYCDDLPKPGETVMGKYQQGFGGKGANQCVGAAKLGASTALITKVGSDYYGGAYLSTLKDAGVDVTHVDQHPSLPTGSALIFVNSKAENAIVVATGAASALSIEDAKAAETLIRNADVFLVTAETPLDQTLEAVKIAKTFNVLTIMNLAPAPSVAVDIKMFDILVVNETEMEAVIGKPVTDVESGKEAVKIAKDLGGNIVILTMGSQGAVWCDTTGVATHVGVPTVEAVDTTGAGDAFTGALAYYLVYRNNHDIGSAVKWACSVATISVQKHGTQASFPKMNELPSYLL